MEDRPLEKYPFDLNNFPFDDATCSELVAKRRNNRANAGRRLFIDALLERAGVHKPRAHFPPRTSVGLRSLYEAYTSACDEYLWKDCITYYLLRWWPDEGLSARKFQNKRYMPPEYAQMVTAYFHLDRSDYKTGTNLLCDPRIPTMHSTLVMGSLMNVSMTIGYPLIRKYVQSVKPRLLELWELKVYMSSLSIGTLGTAWDFQRSFPEGETRSQLLITLIEECFLPVPKQRLVQPLAAFPFNEFEEDVLHKLAREPSRCFYDRAASITLLHNLVVTRLITLGQPARALQLEGQLTIPVDDEDAAKEAAARRRDLISEAAGRDANIYSMDLDEPQASSRPETPRAPRSIQPRRSFVPPPATPLRAKQTPRPSFGRQASSSLNARVPEIQITPNSPMPVASTSRFATPPRQSFADLERFNRSQGAPSPASPSALKIVQAAQAASPLAALPPRGVSGSRNAFYDPSTLQKPDLWDDAGKKPSFRLSVGGPLDGKRSPLSQVTSGEENGNDVDEIDSFVINGARREFRPPTPPQDSVDPEAVQQGTSPFRFRSAEIQSKKEARKGKDKAYDNGQRGVKRVASQYPELPGAFPRLDADAADTSKENQPPLSRTRRKTRHQQAEEDRQNPSNATSREDDNPEMEERDELLPLPSTSTGRARTSRRKRASSIESDASDISTSHPTKVRRSTRLSAAVSDTESVGEGTTSKRKARQGSAARSTNSTGTRRKTKSKA